MADSSAFINGVADVWIAKGMLHFALGEWLQGENHHRKFVVVQRCAMQAEEAHGLLSFLLEKLTENQQGVLVEKKEAENVAQTESSLVSDSVAVKRLLQRSSDQGKGEAHKPFK